MNIIISGGTALQCGSQKRIIHKIDVPSAFVDTLRAQGHNVEWRKIFCKEEDFSKYDLLIACVAPCTSSNAPNIMGCLKAMNRIKNVVVFYDDWKLKEIQGSFNVLLRLEEKQFKKQWSSGQSFYKDEICDIINSKEDILQVAKDITSTGRESWKILCPMFEWGNKDIIQEFIPWLTHKNFNYIDPTPAVIDYCDPYAKIFDKKIGQKQRAWAIASISDQTSWIKKQKLSWPVNYYGCRKLKCERLKTEEDVFEKYTEHHGVLSPAYPSSGSGWFRARYVYAALAKAVLWCGNLDAQCLGTSYQIEPALLELNNERELLDIAEKQKVDLFKHLTTIEQFTDKLNNIIKF